MWKVTVYWTNDDGYQVSEIYLVPDTDKHYASVRAYREWMYDYPEIGDDTKATQSLEYLTGESAYRWR